MSKTQFNQDEQWKYTYTSHYKVTHQVAIAQFHDKRHHVHYKLERKKKKLTLVDCSIKYGESLHLYERTGNKTPNAKNNKVTFSKVSTSYEHFSTITIYDFCCLTFYLETTIKFE